MMITVEQIRAARAMLGLKQHELAKKADISIGTLNNIERGVQTDPKLSTMRAIQHALEILGIEFTEEDNGSIGIRLKAPRNNKARTILIIDDSTAERKRYKAWLGQGQGKDYQILEAANAKEGYEGFMKYKPD